LEAHSTASRATCVSCGVSWSASLGRCTGVFPRRRGVDAARCTVVLGCARRVHVWGPLCHAATEAAGQQPGDAGRGAVRGAGDVDVIAEFADEGEPVSSCACLLARKAPAAVVGHCGCHDPVDPDRAYFDRAAALFAVGVLDGVGERLVATQRDGVCGVRVKPGRVGQEVSWCLRSPVSTPRGLVLPNVALAPWTSRHHDCPFDLLCYARVGSHARSALATDEQVHHRNSLPGATRTRASR
jgi:hypothetical protein